MISEKPMMAFSGVRSSWLMLARKRVLEALARSASALARRRDSSRSLMAVKSDRKMIEPPSLVWLTVMRSQRPSASSSSAWPLSFDIGAGRLGGRQLALDGRQRGVEGLARHQLVGDLGEEAAQRAVGHDDPAVGRGQHHAFAAGLQRFHQPVLGGAAQFRLALDALADIGLHRRHGIQQRAGFVRAAAREWASAFRPWRCGRRRRRRRAAGARYGCAAAR